MAGFELSNTEFPEGAMVKTSAFGATLVLPELPVDETQSDEQKSPLLALSQHPDFEAWTAELASTNVSTGEVK